jgi:hypothetical protein
MRAKLCVPWGGSLQRRGGEMSCPSQVYLVGIRSPGAKAELVSSNGTVIPPSCGTDVGVGRTGSAVGDELAPQPVILIVRKIIKMNSEKSFFIFHLSPVDYLIIKQIFKTTALKILTPQPGY